MYEFFGGRNMEEETLCKSHDLAVNQCSYRVGARKEKNSKQIRSREYGRRKLILVFYKEILRLGNILRKQLPWIAVNTNLHFRKGLDVK